MTYSANTPSKILLGNGISMNFSPYETSFPSFFLNLCNITFITPFNCLHVIIAETSLSIMFIIILMYANFNFIVALVIIIIIGFAQFHYINLTPLQHVFESAFVIEFHKTFCLGAVFSYPPLFCFNFSSPFLVNLYVCECVWECKKCNFILLLLLKILLKQISWVSEWASENECVMWICKVKKILFFINATIEDFHNNLCKVCLVVTNENEKEKKNIF